MKSYGQQTRVKVVKNKVRRRSASLNSDPLTGSGYLTTMPEIN